MTIKFKSKIITKNQFNLIRNIFILELILFLLLLKINLKNNVLDFIYFLPF